MIKLALPDIGEDELIAIKEVLDSKMLIMGDKVLRLETLIKEQIGIEHCFAVSSGTAALHIALMALNITTGDEVIVPAFTFPATANVVEIVGAKVKFVDVKLEDCCIDINQIEKNINANTKAIIIVHEFGQAVDMRKIRELSDKYDLKVIEDAACALGAKDDNIYVGTFGDIGCFSLHPRKAITTGEGGLIVTNNEELAAKISAYRNHGIVYEEGKPSFMMPGLNYRMTNIQGAMGVVQFNKMEQLNTRRREIAELYSILLADTDSISLPTERENSLHIWQTYHILLDSKFNRDYLIKELKNRGIETNYGANAVHIEPYYANKYDVTNLYNAEKLYYSGLALPLHSGLSDSDVHLVAFELIRLLNELN